MMHPLFTAKRSLRWPDVFNLHHLRFNSIQFNSISFYFWKLFDNNPSMYQKKGSIEIQNWVGFNETKNTNIQSANRSCHSSVRIIDWIFHAAVSKYSHEKLNNPIKQWIKLDVVHWPRSEYRIAAIIVLIGFVSFLILFFGGLKLCSQLLFIKKRKNIVNEKDDCVCLLNISNGRPEKNARLYRQSQCCSAWTIRERMRERETARIKQKGREGEKSTEQNGTFVRSVCQRASGTASRNSPSLLRHIYIFIYTINKMNSKRMYSVHNLFCFIVDDFPRLCRAFNKQILTCLKWNLNYVCWKNKFMHDSWNETEI